VSLQTEPPKVDVYTLATNSSTWYKKQKEVWLVFRQTKESFSSCSKERAEVAAEAKRAFCAICTTALLVILLIAANYFCVTEHHHLPRLYSSRQQFVKTGGGSRLV